MIINYKNLKNKEIIQTSTISNGTVLLFTVPAIAVRLAAKAWQERSTAIQGGAKPVASSTHLGYFNNNIFHMILFKRLNEFSSQAKYIIPFSTSEPFFAFPSTQT